MINRTDPGLRVSQTNARRLVEEIASLPEDWHGAGTMSGVVLEAIASHVASFDVLERSAETGSGKTTLLFSNFSQDHHVFSLDAGESIRKVTASPLYRPENVTYVEGPTQKTLPRHIFDLPLQVVLIDGPHGYPFPDLEYFYFYPHITTGGLLIIDDVNIPTIRRMVDIIAAEDMFELEEIVQWTAFLRRTSAPMIDPYGDGWWLQGYNREHYESAMARSQTTENRLVNIFQRVVPSAVRSLLPTRWKTAVLKRL